MIFKNKNKVIIIILKRGQKQTIIGAKSHS